MNVEKEAPQFIPTPFCSPAFHESSHLAAPAPFSHLGRGTARPPAAAFTAFNSSRRRSDDRFGEAAEGVGDVPGFRRAGGARRRDKRARPGGGFSGEGVRPDGTE